MLNAYRTNGTRLERLDPDAPIESAVWIDLLRPDAAQTEAVRVLGVDLPTLADMEEIELSSRLYRENGADYLTVVLPSLSDTRTPVSGPVCFILTPDRLVTVRHHTPRPLETYPERADRVGPGCETPSHVFLSLMEEIIGRLADLLEHVGQGLDDLTASMFQKGAKATDDALQTGLHVVGRESDLLGRVRLSLLTIERAISYFAQSFGPGAGPKDTRAVIKGLMRDIQALEVHGDYLNSRLAMASDVTLGMINLSQNRTVKIVSVVAVIFLPPTVIASAYGMNFANMPELDWRLGYPMAIAMMIASAVLTYLFFKWRRWL